MNKLKNRIRVIVPKGHKNKPLMSSGTKVFVGEHEIHGVTSIQLNSSSGAPWTAVVTFGAIEVIDAED